MPGYSNQSSGCLIGALGDDVQPNKHEGRQCESQLSCGMCRAYLNPNLIIGTLIFYLIFSSVRRSILKATNLDRFLLYIRAPENDHLTADQWKGRQNRRNPLELQKPPTQSHKSRRSEDSKRSGRRKRNSVASSQSASSKYRSIKDWSAGVDATTPPSFGSPVRNAIDPPRAAKPGFEWVWFPEGYWAEREIRGFMPPRDSMKPKWWNRSPDQKSRTPTKTTSGDKLQAVTKPLHLHPSSFHEFKSAAYR